MEHAGIESDVAQIIFEKLNHLNESNQLNGEIIYYQKGEYISHQGNPTRPDNIVWLKKDGSAFKISVDR